MALLKVNVLRGGTPVVKQFKIRSIPHFLLYDPKGKLLGRGGPDFFHSKIAKWKVPKKSSISKIKIISKGKEVDVNAHLVKGKYTIIEFYADW